MGAFSTLIVKFENKLFFKGVRISLISFILFKHLFSIKSFTICNNLYCQSIGFDLIVFNSYLLYEEKMCSRY